MALAILILLILGLVFFLVATVIGYSGEARAARINWMSLGLACWILTAILAAIPA